MDLKVNMNGAKGRPKGSGNKSGVKKTRQEELHELLHPKLGVIKEVRRIKFRDHKNPWEVENEFRQQFLNGEFKVVQSFEFAHEGYLLRSKLDGDLEYQPY